MGSAAAYQLAKRGQRVLGIDQFSPPHAFGSSHGDTRITRLAIGEGVHYTPLVMRSHEIWRDIEKETGADLLASVGGLMISSTARTANLHVRNFFENTVAAAEKFRIPHEVLNAAEIRRRFPQFRVRDGEIGYYERSAGFLRPEACIRAQLTLAEKYGAAIHRNEKVLAFNSSGAAVTVTTERNSYIAEKLILTAGSWLPEIIGGAHANLFRVLRQVLFWFDVKGSIEPFLPGNCPIFIWEVQGSSRAIYGFPAIDGAKGGVKIATQQYETATTPHLVHREVSEDEIAAMYSQCVAPYLPDLDRNCVKAVTCLYTVTSDSGFVIDDHPDFPRVIVASCCSGHGFKHSAAIGEALAELAIDGKTRFDLEAFKIGRFSRQ
jgi:sarcosine oxidase